MVLVVFALCPIKNFRIRFTIIGDKNDSTIFVAASYIESPRGKSCFSVCFSNNREAWRLIPGWMERDGAKRVDCKWWSTDLLTTTDINLTFFDSTPTSIFGKGRRPASSYLSTSEMSRTSTERMQRGKLVCLHQQRQR